jgi:Tol biopolymer transport system component
MALSLTFTVLLPALAEAQYFGRNNPRYQSFEFKVLKTEHFDIYHYAEEAEAARMAARLSERWYDRLSRLLDYRMQTRQPLILYASHPHFRQTNAIPGGIGEGTGGVTESFKRRVVLPLGATLEDSDHVIGHELVHAFQFAMTGADVQRGGMSTALRLPLWFVEGMAEYLSLGPVDAHTAMWIRDAAAREALPSIDELDNPEYFPYRYGHAFWSYVAGRWGDGIVRPLFLAASQPRAGIGALETVLGIDVETLSADWHRAILSQYQPVLAATTPLSGLTPPLISDEHHGGRINLAPAISPDGSKMVFLSERDLFSIDVFVSDARTGEVIRKLVSTATDPHFDSLQFINSAGGWHPDGRQFVVAAVRAGKPVLTIFDVESGKRLRELDLPDLDEAFNPSWSPDGRRIAFTATARGFSDLYVHDLGGGGPVRLTEDRYSDLQPAWSPDGRTLAFATDRFTTDLDTLSIGPTRLASIDVQSRAVRELPGFERGKHISPHWSPDGERLFFVASPAGIPNVHALTLSTGELQTLTNVQTGVSGITALSPAFSIAARTGRAAMAIFSDNEYRIHVVDTPDQIARGAADVLGPELSAAVLPPARRPDASLPRLLSNDTTGLPRTEDFPVEPYRPSLSLDYFAQPTIGVGADRFGTFIGGSVGAVFSDMLGNHQLVAAAQASGELKDIGGQVQYVNLASRWIWGGSLGYIPYRFGGFGQSLGSVEGEPVLVEQTFIERQTSAGGTGMLAYPFSRATRVEFIAGGRHIGFTRELTTDVYSLATGQQIDRIEEDLPAGDSLALVDAGAALVHDTSVFGVTSPILGRRFRFDFTQTAGSLTYSNFIADYRQYWMPVRPITLAVRGLAFGRFGRDADDERLRWSYLGESYLVRGYDVESFDVSECQPGPAGSCQAFDQLVGTRMLVANVELRFPLWSAFGGDDFYGPLPVEMAIFADGGVAWDNVSRPSLFDGHREFVRSVGVAARANLFGFAIGEVAYVRPIDRPRDGWLWQFALRPGF